MPALKVAAPSKDSPPLFGQFGGLSTGRFEKGVGVLLSQGFR